jgi:hypothetical protein
VCHRSGWPTWLVTDSSASRASCHSSPCRGRGSLPVCETRGASARAGAGCSRRDCSCGRPVLPARTSATLPCTVLLLHGNRPAAELAGSKAAANAGHPHLLVVLNGMPLLQAPLDFGGHFVCASVKRLAAACLCAVGGPVACTGGTSLPAVDNQCAAARASDSSALPPPFGRAALLAGTLLAGHPAVFFHGWPWRTARQQPNSVEAQCNLQV